MSTCKDCGYDASGYGSSTHWYKCPNKKLYNRLDDAIERGEITEQDARDIYREEKE